MTLDRFVDLCVIRDCIRHCARVRDGRGAWRAERACAQLLGGTTIDQHTAAAARAFGEWLRNIGYTQKGANRDATGFEGRGSQEPDATDREARGRVMAQGGSGGHALPRLIRAAPASGAAPAFLSSRPATSLLAGPSPSAGASRPGATS